MFGLGVSCSLLLFVAGGGVVCCCCCLLLLLLLGDAGVKHVSGDAFCSVMLSVGAVVFFVASRCCCALMQLVCHLLCVVVVVYRVSRCGLLVGNCCLLLLCGVCCL